VDVRQAFEEFDKYKGGEVGTVRQAVELLKGIGMPGEVAGGLIMVQGAAACLGIKVRTRRWVLETARAWKAVVELPDEGDAFVLIGDVTSAVLAAEYGVDPGVVQPDVTEAHEARKLYLHRQEVAER